MNNNLKHKKTFYRISKLTTDLKEQTKVTSRRSIFQTLYNELSQPATRHALAVDSPTFLALQSAWELVINNSVYAARQIDHKRKEGLTLEDITITFQLIQLADKKHADESYDTAANHPVTPQEFAHYRDVFLINNKEARHVLAFLLDLLNDERACEKAENYLLRTLAGMVAQTGYVSALRSDSQMQSILEEVERRILISEDDEEHVPYDVQVTAAEIFRNLLRTATVDLGLDFPALVASSIKMVATWCTGIAAEADMKNSVQNILLALLEGVCCLIRINPEQACEPLRRHGRVILKCAKKAYRKALDRQNRDIVHEYFLCHLLAVQVAGQLQGRLPGDLGALGGASLSLRWMEDTIEMLLSRYSDVSDVTGSVETQLGESRKKHLELIAHLLSCAQRVYLSEVELETDPSWTVLAKVAQSNVTLPHEMMQPHEHGETLPHVAPDVILQSPFWKTVLVPLMCATSQTPSDLLDSSDDSTRYWGLLEALGKEMAKTKSTHPTMTRHLLQLVSVCATLYPAGACWMTCSHTCWYDLPVRHDDDDDEEEEDESIWGTHVIVPPRYVQGSSPEDLAILINTIRGVFELHGEMNGDAHLQLWATRALEYLTFPSSALALLCDQSFLNEVQSAWRKVWPIIFRRDLRYHSSTASSTPQSHGEAVVSLVASIARHMSVDVKSRWSNNLQLRHTSFLFKNQGDVWNLPLFAEAAEQSGAVASRLAFWLLVSAGLAEGADSIGHDQKELPERRVENRGRRSRLINFFLSCLSWQNQELLEASSSCLALLVHGSAERWMDDIQLTKLEFTNQYLGSIANDLGGEFGHLPLIDPCPVLLLPSTVPSEVVQRFLSKKDRTASSADLLSESMQTTLVEELNDVFDYFYDASDRQSGKDDQLEQHLRFLDAEVMFLTASPATTVKLRYADFCKKAASCTESFKSAFLSSAPPSTFCFQMLRRVLKKLLFLGAQYDLPLSRCIRASGVELYSELIAILDDFPAKKQSKSKSSSAGVSVNFDSDDESAAGGSEAGWSVKKNPKKSKASSSIPFDSDNESTRENADRKFKKNQKKSKSSSAGISMGFDSDDELSREQEARWDSKRTGQESSIDSPSKRPKTIVSQLEPIDVFVSADIAMTLRPTCRTLKKVIGALTGAEFNRHGVPHIAELDPAAAIYILWLICNSALRCDKDELESILALSLELMKAFKESAAATNDSTAFCFAYCVRIFQQRIQSNASHELSSAESSDLLSMLTDIESAERKFRNLHPLSRVGSVRMASRVFWGGGTDLREQWGKTFPGLVLPGLCDSSGIVRRQSSWSISKCLTSTPNEKSVIDSTLRNIFIEDGPESYREWYRSIFPKLDVTGEQMWEDLLPSVACSSLLCMALIGGRTSLAIDQAKIYFRLVEMASRDPQREGGCFLALEQMGRMGGYETVEALTSDCSHDFLLLLFSDKNRRPTISALPLILTSPGTVRQMLKTGSLMKLKDPELESLRFEAAYEFATRSQSLFPILLSTASCPITEDDGIKDFLSLYDDEEPAEKLVAKLVRQFVPGICALSLCLKWGSSDDQERASVLSQRLLELVPQEKLEQIMKRSASSTVFGIFGSIGSPVVASEVSVSDIKEGILEFTKQFGDVGSRDPFYEVGVSCLELLLFASNKLVRSRRSCRAVNWLKPFEVVASTLLSSLGSDKMHNPPLGFFFFLVSGLLTWNLDYKIISEILLATKDVVEGMLNCPERNTRVALLEEAKQDFEILLVSTVGLHERNQKQMLEAFRSSFFRMKRVALLSMGIDGHVDENGTISNSIDSSSLFSNETEHFRRLLRATYHDDNKYNKYRWSPKVLEATHDFVTWIIEHEKSLGVQSQNFLSSQTPTSPGPSDYAILEKLDSRFCLQSSSTQTETLSRESPSEILCQIRRLVESMAPAFTEVALGDAMPISPARRLLSIQLENFSASLSGETVLSGEEVLTTVQLFAKLCQGRSKNMVHACIACLGRLRPSLETGCFPDHAGVEKEPSETSGALDFSLLSLEAKCVQNLSLLLRAEDHTKAIISCETLGAFLKRKQSVQFSRLVDDKTIRSLGPFFSRRGKSTSKTLDRHMKGQLKHHFGGSSTWEDWCWNESAWKNALTMPFESWICLVVPAMLVCRQESEKSGNPHQDYLGDFQRMAQLDAGFASTVFPLCILQSLADTVASEEQLDSTETDTWIGSPGTKSNELISKCFLSLLSSCLETQSDDLRAVTLVLDTLDLLRSLTQTRFLQSDNHVPNDRIKRPSQTDSSEGSHGSVSLEGTKTWRGVVYGVVVRVDGLLIARACARVGRYASARLYAEAYADSRFGRSVQALQMLSPDSELPFTSRTDVSGFGPHLGADDTVTSSNSSLLRDACNFLEVLRQCSVVDGQTAETSALESLSSDISLALSDSAQEWYRVSSQSPLDELRHLGSEGLSQDRTASMVDCLSKLAVPGVLQSFVVGRTLLNKNDALQPSVSKKWFESCLEDPRLFDVDTSNGTDLSTNFEKLCGMFPSENVCFHEVFLSGLSSYAKDDVKTCNVRVAASREQMVEDLVGVASGESTWEEASRLLDRASALHELDRLVRGDVSKDSIYESWIQKKSTIFGTVSVEKTSPYMVFPVSDFTREVALRAAVNRSSAGPMGRTQKLSGDLRALLWQTAKVNRILGHVDKCEALLARLRVAMPQTNPSMEETLRLYMLEADIQESRGNKLLAIRSMKQVVQWLGRATGDSSREETLAESLIDLGTRLSAHKAETGEVIATEYFEPGISLARKYNERQNCTRSQQILCKGHLAHGDLLMNLHQILLSRVSSKEWSKGERSLVEREKELKEMDALFNSQNKKQNKGKPMDRDLSIYRLTLRKEVHNARETRQRIEMSVNDFLLRATKNIVEGLSIAGTDTRGASKYVYRLISIWFGSTSPDISDDLQELFCSAVERIPTYRFVPLTNQIFARLGTADSFSSNLETLARKMCCDHPYQCIVHLVRCISDEPTSDTIQAGKSRVAEEVLSKVKSESRGILLPLVEGYEILCGTYIKFASLDPNKLVLDRKRRCRMTSVERGARIDECLGRGSRRRPFPPCVVTKPPQIRPGCDYDDVETVIGFDDTFTLADSGLTRPKIVVCHGSHGSKFRQLVKGGDDCRGDAVMEQVFHYVNELFGSQRDLASSVSTERNKILTYNIVPLNRKTGVLEWVENTTPLADYISDNRAPGGIGAHSRYYPGEWGFRFCRDHLDKASVKNKRKAFDDICRHHSPVFRFFFVERFGRNPQSWYSAKKKYSRSVAVSSFVGHVLGIGDRHGSNILIHKGTGEVVHIDFGIVFEQGKLLNCPERVPFRLTQNIVDGLGPTEHEGIFTSAAESTLSVLRKNADSLLTILSAVVNDPLYKWSVSPMQAGRRQRIASAEEGPVDKTGRGDDDFEDRNEAANHAIRRVREKLNGYEDGTSGEQQTIEGQVRFLVRAARDFDDLSQMYAGWAPWM